MRYFKTSNTSLYRAYCDNLAEHTASANKFAKEVGAEKPHLVYDGAWCRGFVFRDTPGPAWCDILAVAEYQIYRPNINDPYGEKLDELFRKTVQEKEPRGVPLLTSLGYRFAKQPHTMVWTGLIRWMLFHHGELYFEVSPRFSFEPAPGVLEILGSVYEDAKRQDLEDKESYLAEQN